MMEKMVFVTGFARGGTSWLRDCIGSHPKIGILPNERTVFRDLKDGDAIRAYFQQETAGITESWIVNKAPANAPFIGRSARAFPESKFIFIIRDPRDVLVSHQRGTKKWMGGANKEVKGCMTKIQKYYEGWMDAQGLPNVLLVRYEDLHQNFTKTMGNVFAFIGAESDEKILSKVFAENTFQAQTKRSNKEDRDSAKRKGVIGDWSLFLKDSELNWYRKSDFFRQLMTKHDYNWVLNTYANIVKAMHEAGMNFLSEDDLLRRRLDPNRPNVVLQHDIDYLNKSWCEKSVERTAAIESELGVPACYNFLPLDDKRYDAGPKKAPRLMKSIVSINPRAAIGLHVNACERFFPPDVPDAGQGANLSQVMDYLRRQVNDYKTIGVTFRTATAHGYGRGKKLPNNRDTAEITVELAKSNITLFDTTIRPELVSAASYTSAITDVGGTLKPRRLDKGYDLTDRRTYESLPRGSFLRFLTHPGNYPVDDPSTIAMCSPGRDDGE
jgi:hypothetical protein